MGLNAQSWSDPAGANEEMTSLQIKTDSLAQRALRGSEAWIRRFGIVGVGCELMQLE